MRCDSPSVPRGLNLTIYITILNAGKYPASRCCGFLQFHLGILTTTSSRLGYTLQQTQLYFLTIFPVVAIVDVSRLYRFPYYVRRHGGKKRAFQKLTHPWSLCCCYKSKGSSKRPKSRRMWVFFSHTGSTDRRTHTHTGTTMAVVTTSATVDCCFHLKAMV